ncbi:hypothetical protein [Chthonobacter albigriseus]|uniref:hypothetical protein n=1 Tax=Chthonobacter albigriseus TaxID=1683161 RepID=UPI0015EE4CE9|nr:hypothetical protein [Chthonobacter albigriseus]
MRNRPILAAVCGLIPLVLASGPAVSADPYAEPGPFDAPAPLPPDRPTVKAVAAIASDDYREGISTTDHGLYAFGRVEAAYGAFYGALATFTEGDDPDMGVALTAGARPTLGQVAFDVSLTREQIFGNPDASDFVLHGHASAPVAENVTATGGSTYTLADEGRDTWDLYAAAAMSIPEAVNLGGKVTYQPYSDVSPDAAIKVGGSIEVPLPKGFSVSSGLTYAHYVDDDVPNYAWYDIGASWKATEWATVDLRWHGNTLSAGDCAAHAATDCDGRIVGKLILNQEFGM